MDFSEIEIFLFTELQRMSIKCGELSRTDSKDVHKLLEISDDLEAISSWIKKKIIEKSTGLDEIV